MSKRLNIAFLGLGAMGSRMAMNLIKAGHNVTVWNRTSSAAAPLVEAGAHQAQSAKDAALNADFVIAMVRDNEASREVWLDPEKGALAGMKAGSIAIESSTLTPEWIRELGQTTAASGVSLLEAPVSGTRPQAEAGQLIYLVGGDEATLRKAEPVLAIMGGSIILVGDLGTAALAKLTTNTLLGIQVTAYAELIGMLTRSGADVARILGAVAETSVWSPVASYLTGSMLTKNFSPMFPIELIEKDFDYTLQKVGAEGMAPTINAAHQVFRKAVDKGLGDENMTGVVRLFEESSKVLF
ncbi:NAD(P)-dependent oxidoreductase [Fulvivirga ulvae]|uniref:NAD(P)-dependent oxidoreductase n=1 Tax=Fulvivirga ulvae TaxID=2904245 RepID=UPI001F37E839|nr:NAD(P)-dependent oxidoreductase [Fulvivirga ulvae]UII31709.1 NAD(P)-dependent oxidoreductase [Fulvivirga ulvae]